MKDIVLCFVTIVSALGMTNIFAQTPNVPFQKEALHFTQNLYNQYFEKDSRLFIGTEYNEFDKPTSGHSFFLSSDFIDGSITYDLQYYDSVPLLFDLVGDELLTERLSDAVKIRLVQEKVSEFSIANHRFVRLQSYSGAFYGKGFYEVLHSGVVSAYAKWTKEQSKDLSDPTVKISVVESTRYFIESGGVFFSVRGKSSLLKKFKDKKVLIRSFIKKNGIQFGDNPSRAISLIAEYYNSIKSTP
jgi:hypothetical protein